MSHNWPNTVTIVGLGNLGAPLAATLAARGMAVNGVDTNPRTVASLAARVACVPEPGLSELLRCTSELRVSEDLGSAVCSSDVTGIVLPTPSRADGSFDASMVRQVIGQIGELLRHRSGYHLVWLVSTVSPGQCREELVPELERAAGRRCGQGFGFAYSPTFVALGNTIRGFAQPEFLLIGANDADSHERLASLFRRVYGSEMPHICRTSLDNAELAKLALNVFVTMKIAFINSVAEIAARRTGGDIDAIADVLGRDSRIGPKCLSVGLGAGGPCFPRDARALSAAARDAGATTELFATIDRCNRETQERLLNIVLDSVVAGSRVAVIGLSYKPGTPHIVGSRSVELAELLMRNGCDVTGWDPSISSVDEICRSLPFRIAASLDECLMSADVFVITAQHAAVAAIRWDELASAKERITIVDCWRTIDTTAISCPNVHVIGWGRSAQHEQSLSSAAHESY